MYKVIIPMNNTLFPELFAGALPLDVLVLDFDTYDELNPPTELKQEPFLKDITNFRRRKPYQDQRRY